MDLVVEPGPSQSLSDCLGRRGTMLGKVDGKKVGENRLRAKKGYERASPGQRVWYTVEGIFE
jgi:hypothetical protein